MGFFSGLDAASEVADVLDLVEIDTPDGPARFLLGDGKFTDRDGNAWWGSSLASVSDMEASIGGVAPSGNLVLSFFQDPDSADMVAEVKALGLDYVKGRDITFWVQPLLSPNEFWAPTLPMQRFLTRRITGLVTAMNGPMIRTIGVEFEGPFSNRNTAKRRQYTTADHSALVGAANPSLEFMPKDGRQDELIWG